MSPAMQVLPHAQPTVVQMLAAAQAAPHREALVFGDRRLDYAGYLACVARFARELPSLNVAGGRVATLVGNSIVAGYNVYPREVEEVLFAHPDVADAAVVGRPDAYRGEVLVAHVVPRPRADPDAETLLAHCRERLARYKLPAQWHFADALPKTRANKTDKNALRRA